MDEKITLYDEEGKPLEVSVLDMVNIENREYLIVAPLDDQDNPFALRVNKDSKGEDVLEIVTEDSELDEIQAKLEEEEDDEE